MYLIDRDHYEADLRSCLSDSPPQFSQGLHCALGVLARQMEISSAWTWISVEDRLPEDGQDVLAVFRMVRHGHLGDAFLGLAYYTGCGQFESSSFNMSLCVVTHWAPLPPLPGEVTA